MFINLRSLSAWSQFTVIRSVGTWLRYPCTEKKYDLYLGKKSWKKGNSYSDCSTTAPFFPEKSWRKDILLKFWKKPMGDKETFKLLLFFHGNGCNPEIISRWILLAQSWASSQATAEKRARQIQFVNDNVDSKRHQWFYYDLDYSKLLYLNGLPRQTPRQQWRVDFFESLLLKPVASIPL